MIPRSIVILISAAILIIDLPAFAQYPIVSDDVVCATGIVCYDNPVASGATVISAVSTSQVIFTVTTVIGKGSSCNNTTSSAATLTITDGTAAANQLLSAFSVPANSYISFNDRIGTILTSGLKVFSGTVNAFTCWFNGRQ